MDSVPETARTPDRLAPGGVLATVTDAAAEAYAGWFAALADPIRVRLLLTVSTARGAVPLGELESALGITRSACAEHVRTLAEAGLVVVEEGHGSATVTASPAGCTGLPHPADLVLGTPVLPARGLGDPPADVRTRAMTAADLPVVREIYAEGIATRQATFETEAPDLATLATKWLSEHRWVAEAPVDGVRRVVGWTAVSPASSRACYAGVGESSVYVAEVARGRGVGRALLRRQVAEADAGGLWTLQTVIFPENRASLALHHAAGYRTLAVRSRAAQLDGVWRDTVLLERRRAAD
ncbi:helix-turn-helix domain-containing GNAT family N-acetyltransferase [Nocardioides ochotonae]|uniref:helix-turn-helix domain-containing GNAT family N-acetyltransferase n=1 Tax=Nocardioides ochotonae TaxID=2685869 RepID=UPI003132BD9B